MSRDFWHSLPDNIQWGLIWGASSAGFFSLIAIAIWIFIGLPLGEIQAAPPEWEGATLRFNLWSILIGYWVAGLAGGAVAGWLRPLGQHSYWGASIVGIVAGFVISWPLFVSMFGISGWSAPVYATGIAAPFFLGPFYACLIRWRYSGQLKKRKDGSWQVDR